MRASIKFPPVVLASLAVLVILVSLWAPALPASSIRPEARPGPRLIADVLTEQVQIDLWTWPYSNFVDSVPYGEVVLFRAWDGVHGWELWRTDGTPKGTEMVVDICPGVCDSVPWELRAMLGYVFFQADDGDHGRGIWRTDGTRGGTVLVADVPEGMARLEGVPLGPFLAEFDSALFFVADDGESGPELWRSDGLPGGAVELVADIQPGPEGSWPASLYVVGENLFFTADDGVTGRELWRSDGTSGGTHRVADLCPGPADCFWHEQVAPPAGPRIFNAVGDRLIFRAGDTSAWEQLWVSDGTAAGTRRIEGLTVGRILTFRTPGGSVLLSASSGSGGYELWRTDGTAAGTSLVKEIRPGWDGSSPSEVAATDGVVFLRANDGIHGWELWRTDGTGGGTALVKDILAGPDSGVGWNYFPLAPRPTAGPAYFAGDDGESGQELWRTDGTPEGTFLVEDANPGPGWGLWDIWFHTHASELDGQLIFYAMDPVLRARLWVTDGGSAGADLIAPIDLQASSMERGGWLWTRPEIAAAGGTVLFAAEDGEHGIELWGTDGTSQGTRLIKDLCEEDCDPFLRGPRSLTRVGESVYFSGYCDPGTCLWVSDGTEAGTRPVDPESTQGFPWDFTPWRTPGKPARLLFVNGNNLFVTDGSPGSTVRLSYGSARHPTPAHRQVFFNQDDQGDSELWITLGEPGDERRVLDIAPGEDGSDPQRLTALGDRIVFSADDGLTGREMWVSDGSAAGTFQLMDIRPGPESSVLSITSFTRGNDIGATLEVSGQVYFPANDGSRGEELWRTDGTRGGTGPVADIYAGPGSSEPRPWAAVGSTLYFSAWDPVHGRELWRAENDSRGARLVIDLDPGPGSGVSDLQLKREIGTYLDQPVFWRGRLYFAGTDGTSGLELWSTDGTKAGTRREGDIHPGPGSSSPDGLTPFGKILVFSATDGARGWEIWALDGPSADIGRPPRPGMERR